MQSADAPALVWLRQDLRLGDNPALSAAVIRKRPIILTYLLDDQTPGRWRMGGASRWWLHRSLEALARDVGKRGGRLLLRRGVAREVIPRLARDCGAAAVFWNRCYEPFAIQRDTELKETLTAAGIEAASFNGAQIYEPWTVKTKTGEPYKVFTPYWRACLQSGPARAPLPAPKKIVFATSTAPSASLDEWDLLPKWPNWAAAFEAEWTPGEASARAALETFLEDGLQAYPVARNEMGIAGTSRLSPHLHFGEISAAQIMATVEAAVERRPALRGAADKFLAEIGWREFSTNLLFHWPSLPETNWRDQFNAFPWSDDEAAFRAWTRGKTGYPIVDAAMRELWATGYMHNRARMVAASFLIKHLMIDWRRGQDWFWDTLVDADLANNSASWQWVAGSGADASPYFRIFNPVSQGERYDKGGDYVRRWLPELARLPDDVLHRPWEADIETLRNAGVKLGTTYPEPIVDHAAARARALAAFASLTS